MKLNSDLAQVRKWFIKNKPHIHPPKSKLLFIGSSYSLKNKVSEQPFVVNIQPTPRTSAHKCLGVHIDETLSWDCHIDMICKKVSAGIRTIQNFVLGLTLETVHKGLVQPYFEYCSPVWDKIPVTCCYSSHWCQLWYSLRRFHWLPFLTSTWR